MVPDDLKSFLDYDIVHIAGAVVTPGTLMVGGGVIILSIAIAHVAARGMRSLLARKGLDPGAQFAASKIVRYTLVALGTVVALSSMGLRLDALVATSAVLAVGIGFGLQNVAQNFISGVILLIEQPVRKGDFVKVGDALGVIDDIGLRATHIITRDEVTIIVPNSQFITEPVVNHSRPTTRLRVRIPVSVAYGSNLAKARDALLRVAAQEAALLKEPPPDVRFDGFGDSSLDLALLVWIADPQADLRTASAVRFAIDAAFRADGIEIPFPQRDVHVRSMTAPTGGGVAVSERLRTAG